MFLHSTHLQIRANWEVSEAFLTSMTLQSRPCVVHSTIWSAVTPGYDWRGYQDTWEEAFQHWWLPAPRSRTILLISKRRLKQHCHCCAPHHRHHVCLIIVIVCALSSSPCAPLCCHPMCLFIVAICALSLSSRTYYNLNSSFLFT